MQSVPSTASQESLETWDSLTAISVLDRLDEEFGQVTKRAPELASATSIPEIVVIIEKCDPSA